MNRQTLGADATHLRNTLLLVLGLSVLVPLSGLGLVHLGWVSDHASDLPLHAVIESVGAVLAVGAALLLLRLDTMGGGGRCNRSLAGGLLAMAVLGLSHGVQSPGDGFVWLHVTGLALGGLMFASTALPERWRGGWNRVAPYCGLVLALAIALHAWWWPESVPSMREPGGFSAWADGLSGVAAVGMALAAWTLWASYRRHHAAVDLLFAMLSLLWSLAALMFIWSSLWDATWWAWHVLRLLSCVGAVWLLVTDRLLLEQRREQVLQAREQQVAGQLREQELRFSQVIEGAQVGTWRWNVLTQAAHCDERWALMMGYRLDELGDDPMRRWQLLAHPDDLPSAEAALNRHLAGEAAHYECEIRLRHKSGDWIWVLDRGHVLTRDAQGRPEWLAGIQMDISPRKLAEANAKRNADLLQGSIDAVDAAFVLCDPEDRLVIWNQRFEALYPASAHLLQPGLSFEVLTRHQAHSGSFSEAIGREEDWVRERMAVHRRGGATLVVKLGDGRWIRVLERKMPDGHIVGFRFDITELMEATEAAEEGSRAKSQFLANMSHELRTPMNAILGMLALLRKTELSARQADYAAKSEGAARSLLGLLNDILDLSKVEAGKMTIEQHPFRLDELLHDLAVILAASTGNKPIEVLFDLPPDLPVHLIGDALRLQQVLINLAGNAVKFTERGEVVLSIRLTSRDADRVSLRFEVRDTGIGISPENQARIFSGFTQAEASITRRFGGTGLGLSISQRLVTLMGGQLALTSALGQGSRFWFDLDFPLVAAQTHRTLVDADKVSADGDWRVLVVDDNETARSVLAAQADALGWHVDQAASGEQALALIQSAEQREQPYRAILVDWLMPGLDGWQTCERIRALKLNDGPPLVLMVTAQGRDMLSLRSEQEQAMLNGFLVKPIMTGALAEAVREARSGGRPMARSPSEGSAQALKDLRLLLVEDNANNQQVARELLEDAGALVAVADDGDIAVQMLRAQPSDFDLVLMDLQMPVLDGFSATRIIRQELGLTALPIVAMTANAMASDRQACLDAGMNEHVGKPFDMTQLTRVLLHMTGRESVAVEERVMPTLLLPPALHDEALRRGVDAQTVMDRLLGKTGLFKRMVASFTTSALSLSAQTTQLQQQGKWQDAQLAFHSFKGLAGTLGCAALQGLGAEAEEAAKQGQAMGEAWMQALDRQVQETTDTLAWLVDQIAQLESLNAVAPVSVPVDARPHLEQLLCLLRDQDMSAMEAMERVRPVLQARPEHAARLVALDAALGQLDFAEASRLTEQCLASL